MPLLGAQADMMHGLVKTEKRKMLALFAHMLILCVPAPTKKCLLGFGKIVRAFECLKGQTQQWKLIEASSEFVQHTNKKDL